MIKVEGMLLYTIDEAAKKFHEMIMDELELDQEININVVESDGHLICDVSATKKEILESTLIFLGNHDVFDNLEMFSLGNDDADDITIEDIKKTLNQYGLKDGSHYYSFDEDYYV